MIPSSKGLMSWAHLGRTLDRVLYVPMKERILRMVVGCPHVDNVNTLWGLAERDPSDQIEPSIVDFGVMTVLLAERCRSHILSV